MLDELLKEIGTELDYKLSEILHIVGDNGKYVPALGRAIAVMYDMYDGTDESLEILFDAIRKDLAMFRNKKDEKEC